MDLQKAPRKGDKKEDAVLEKCSIKGDKRCFSMDILVALLSGLLCSS